MKIDWKSLKNTQISTFISVTIILVLILLIVSYLSGIAFGANDGQPEEHKVNICHRTASDTNPYVEIEIDESALDTHLHNGQGHPAKTNADGSPRNDIYPVPEGGCPAGEEPPVDICPNIEGNQATLPEGYTIEGDNCVPIPPTDVCPNIEGAQATIPQGFMLNDGHCVPIPPPPVDVCPNLEGNQAEVPQGYHMDGNDCVPDLPPPPPPCEKPAIPTSFALDTGVKGDGKMQLTWSGTGTSTYVQYTDTTPGDWKWSFTTPNDGEEEVSGLTNNTHYWFRVALVNDCGTGAFSDAIDPLP